MTHSLVMTNAMKTTTLADQLSAARAAHQAALDEASKANDFGDKVRAKVAVQRTGDEVFRLERIIGYTAANKPATPAWMRGPTKRSRKSGGGRLAGAILMAQIGPINGPR